MPITDASENEGWTTLRLSAQFLTDLLDRIFDQVIMEDTIDFTRSGFTVTIVRDEKENEFRALVMGRPFVSEEKTEKGANTRYQAFLAETGQWGMEFFDPQTNRGGLLYEPEFARETIQRMAAYMNEHGYRTFEQLAEIFPELLAP